MSLQHIQKNSPRLLPKPAKFEKNPPNGYRVIRKTKCGAGGAAGAGGARSSPIHKQASLAGRLMNRTNLFFNSLSCLFIRLLTDPTLKNIMNRTILFFNSLTCLFIRLLTDPTLKNIMNRTILFFNSLSCLFIRLLTAPR